MLSNTLNLKSLDHKLVDIIKEEIKKLEEEEKGSKLNKNG